MSEERTGITTTHSMRISHLVTIVVTVCVHGHLLFRLLASHTLSHVIVYIVNSYVCIAVVCYYNKAQTLKILVIWVGGLQHGPFSASLLNTIFS